MLATKEKCSYCNIKHSQYGQNFANENAKMNGALMCIYRDGFGIYSLYFNVAESRKFNVWYSKKIDACPMCGRDLYKNEN